MKLSIKEFFGENNVQVCPKTQMMKKKRFMYSLHHGVIVFNEEFKITVAYCNITAWNNMMAKNFQVECQVKNYD